MTNQWVGNIVANNVNSVHSVTPFWKTCYGFLKDINWSNTQILINCDAVPTHLKQTTKKVVFTSYGESPRYPELMLLANSYPEVNFIWLADLEVYDYPLPFNVTFVQYRHWYIWLEYFHDCILLEQIPKVKKLVSPVEEVRVRIGQNIRRVDQHHRLVELKVKVKNGVKKL
jgi:hypothetical protein